MKKIYKYSYLIIVLLFVSCLKNSDSNTNIIKISNDRYNGKTLASASTLLEHVQKPDSVQALNFTINRELLYLEALENNFDKDLDVLKLTEKYYKELLANKFLDYHLSEKISVSDQELVSFYNKNRTSFQLKKARARIVHYLFDNIDDANSSKRILLYGDISQKNELTERFFPEKKMVTEGKLISVLDKAIFKSRQQHSILGPLRSEFGYHVVEISEYFPANSYLPVAEVKNIIRERIGNNKRNIEYKNLLKTLKDKYDIKTP